MPEFVYVARKPNGEDVTGRLVAGSKREAICALAEKQLYPIKVESPRATTFWPVRKRVRTSLLSSTLSQLADLLQNGVPLLQALSILAEQAAHPELARVLSDIRDQVSEGASLDEAMAAHPHVFGELVVSMVRAGCEGAFLEDALRRTAQFLDLQDEIRSRVIGAMFYPAFLAVVGVVITAVLVIFFVPRFAALFVERLEREGGGLPLATVILLGISDFLRNHGLLFLLIVIGMVWLLRQAAATDKGRYLIDRWKLKIPLLGPIFLGYAVSRFCRILGTLLGNGVPLLKALEISADSAGNKVLADAVRESIENVSSGQRLSEPLAACRLIPTPIMAMITVAEESNTLDRVLVDIADGLDRQLGRRIDLMVRMIEPLMLLVMGLVIMFVLVALLLPIIELSSSF